MQQIDTIFHVICFINLDNGTVIFFYWWILATKFL